MGRIQDVEETLVSEWNRLESVWETARSNWKDPVGDHFEKVYWNQWIEEAFELRRSLDDLEDTLEQALRHTQ